MNKPLPTESTYQVDGKWKTLRTIDATNQIEVDATADEIAAAKAISPVVAEPKPAKKPATKPKAKAKK